MSDTQQYREVQRKANAGERIKIVNARGTCGMYHNGSEFVADEVTKFGVRVPEVAAKNNSTGYIADEEYVVLESSTPVIAAAAPTTASLPDLFAQFIRDNAPAVRSYLAEIDPDMSAEVSVSEPRLTRAKVIEMARERVAELERIGTNPNAELPQGPFRTHFYSVEFHVNRDKRTVTALVRRLGNRRGKPDAVGIAKCAPDDVFNADIGKAIAAERALVLTLTAAFVDAPEPVPASGAKVRKITGRNIGQVFTLTRRRPDCDGMGYGGNAFNTEGAGWIGDNQYAIIDDTDATYTQEAGEAA